MNSSATGVSVSASGVRPALRNAITTLKKAASVTSFSFLLLAITCSISAFVSSASFSGIIRAAQPLPGRSLASSAIVGSSPCRALR